MSKRLSWDQAGQCVRGRSLDRKPTARQARLSAPRRYCVYEIELSKESGLSASGIPNIYSDSLRHHNSCRAVDFPDALHVAQAFFAWGFGRLIVQDAVGEVIGFAGEVDGVFVGVGLV